METQAKRDASKEGKAGARRILITYGVPFVVAVVLFSSMFAFALKHHWIEQSIDTGPVVPGTMNMVLSPDGGSFHMTYTAVGGGLLYATNESGKWVKTELVPWTVSKASLFIDSKKTVHVAAVNESNGDLLYITKVQGQWNISTVDDGVDPSGGCALAVDSRGVDHFAYSKLRSTSIYTTQDGVPAWINYTQADIWYASGKIRNWTSLQMQVRALPHTTDSNSMAGCDILVTEKGVRAYPYIVYSLDTGAVELFNRSGTKWFEEDLGIAASSRPGLSIDKDVNGTLHIYFLARDKESGIIQAVHFQNTGVNQTFTSEIAGSFSSAGSSPIMFAGMDYDRRLHIVYSDSLQTRYLVGSWNSTYRVHELSGKVTNASTPMLFDLSGRIYAVVDGTSTTVVTDNLTVWEQMELNGTFTLITGVGTAVVLGLMGLMYLVNRRARTA